MLMESSERGQSSWTKVMGDILALPLKKHGRPFFLGKELDTHVQMYLKKVREAAPTTKCLGELPSRSCRIVMAGS